MADTIDEVKRDVERLSDEVRKLSASIDQLSAKVDHIFKEVGTREGRMLYQQMDDFERKIAEFDRNITQTMRDSRATRKLTEFGDIRLKEIMRALSYIYRNTDELESNLIEAENLKTTE